MFCRKTIKTLVLCRRVQSKLSENLDEVADQMLGSLGEDASPEQKQDVAKGNRLSAAHFIWVFLVIFFSHVNIRSCIVNR